MVEYPPGEPQDVCAICGEPFERDDPDFASKYANPVCESCDERAVTEKSDRLQVRNDFLGRETVATNDDGDRVIQPGPDIGDGGAILINVGESSHRDG